MAKPKDVSGKSIFISGAILVFGLIVALSEQVFGNVLTDSIIKVVAKIFGIEPSIMMAAVTAYIFQFAIIGTLLWCMFRLSGWYLRRTIFIDDPNLPAASLRQMPVTEIAEYVRDESAWCYREYAKLNSRRQVEIFTPNEISRAARWHEVRFRGVVPNAGSTIDIDDYYWQIAEISADHVWDKRNTTGAVARPNCSAVSMQYLTAPMVDVYKAWPKATVIGKCCAVIWVALKKSWFGVTGAIKLMRFRIFGSN